MEKEISMRNYIAETPATALDNIVNSESLTRSLVELFLRREYKSVWLVACGSSCNAAYCARYYMKKYLGVEVKIVTPFTFNHYENDAQPDDFVVCISQSGCSTNTLTSLRICRSRGIDAIGLTGNPDSDFKNVSTVVDCGLKSEKLDFVTKGVVTLALFLMLFSLHAAARLGRINDSELAQQKDLLRAAIGNYSYILDNFAKFAERNRKNLLSMNVAYVLGAGANYGTALEGAVKIGETVHVPAIGYELEESIHGPQIQLTPNYTFIIIDPNDDSSEMACKCYEAASRITERVFMLSNSDSVSGSGVMRVPVLTPQEISPLYALAFVQMIACYAAETLVSWRVHPLMEDFRSVLFGKSDTYRAYNCVGKVPDGLE